MNTFCRRGLSQKLSLFSLNTWRQMAYLRTSSRRWCLLRSSTRTPSQVGLGEARGLVKGCHRKRPFQSGLIKFYLFGFLRKAWVLDFFAWVPNDLVKSLGIKLESLRWIEVNIRIKAVCWRWRHYGKSNVNTSGGIFCTIKRDWGKKSLGA